MWVADAMSTGHHTIGRREKSIMIRIGALLAAAAETMTPQQFGDLMRLETERWTKVAHEANISID